LRLARVVSAAALSLARSIGELRFDVEAPAKLSTFFDLHAL